ncbi:2,3-diaminopropionate biosynthesis protein SbnA [Kitasatospora mediocidica]|uniref:2,3-diaminopropionate biosynthesis protein SbnA n=1 Tax=Kitasatospora mediocidica TaxID=58352 RepID=UPI0005694C45|nr:2,3-diaminopropionate biosynthesis protein SbnA [Kitasatospora mediocidica]
MIRSNAYELVTDDMFLQLSDVLHDSDLFLKIEGLNPAGSVKLKTAVGLIQDAEDRGLLGPGGSVVESSSGNLGVALSVVCAAKGYAFTCVTDPNVSAQSMAAMKALGTKVVVVSERDANGGFLATRINLIKRMLAEDPELLWTNQYANAANPHVHFTRTAASTAAEIGTVDHLFVGAGTTGTLMGCADYFRRFSPNTRIIAVDTVGSVTFGGPSGPRFVPGLGTSRRPEVFRPEMVDDVILVNEVDAVRACRTIARRYGVLVGGSTGSVFAAVQAQAGLIPPGSRVVALSPDLGERYLATIYNDEWVAARFGADAVTTVNTVNQSEFPVASWEMNVV